MLKRNGGSLQWLTGIEGLMNLPQRPLRGEKIKKANEREPNYLVQLR